MGIVENPDVIPTEQTVTSKKKKGFDPDQLRKTIVTKIDKDGFHERTVYYGKDSAGSGDWSTAHVTFKCQNEDLSNSNGYTVYVPSLISGEFYNSPISVYPDDDPPFEAEVPLYKGSLILECSTILDYSDIINVDRSTTPIVSGGVSLQPAKFGGFDIVITGDGTFTAQAASGGPD